jgi:C4-dicarboxylate-specific signal transduction histidine kinase
MECPHPMREHMPNFWRLGRLLCYLLLVFACGFLAYQIVFSRQINALRSNGEHRLDLYANTLARQIGQYAYLPKVLGLDSHVIGLMRAPQAPGLLLQVNQHLQQLNQQVGTLDIFLIDHKGRVLASSNWNQVDSFIGRDLSYRSYVQQAHPHGVAEFYGIGTTHNDPGYYLSSALMDQGRQVGVAAVKLSLDQLEKSWSNAESPALLSDENGVIVLSSVPAWKYTTLQRMSTAQLHQLDVTQQYNRRKLLPLGLIQRQEIDESTRIVELHPRADRALPGFATRGLFLTRTRQIKGTPWHLTVFYDLHPTLDLAHTSAALAGAAMALLIAAGLLLSARSRARTASLRSRRLSQNNARLQQEIRERLEAERNLKSAQDELIQASKLAVIGQMAAGVAHEINQPLAALGALSENASEFLNRGDIPTAQANLGRISALVQRLGAITGQLRGYARRSSATLEEVDLALVIEQGLCLMDASLRKASIDVVQRPPTERLMVQANSLRLQQVLVNLLTNAIDACAAQGYGRIELAWQQQGSVVQLTVHDNGPGLPEGVQQHLFEPFYTSKPNGLGLGLAISLSIMRDFGGSLSAGNHAQGGACFVLELLPAGAGGAASGIL